MRKDLKSAFGVRCVELLSDSSSQAPLNDGEGGFGKEILSLRSRMTGGVEEGFARRATSGRPYKGGRLEWKDLECDSCERTVEDDELPVPQGKTLITFLRTR